MRLAQSSVSADCSIKRERGGESPIQRERGGILHSALKQPSPSCADLLVSGTRASEDSAALTQANGRHAQPRAPPSQQISFFGRNDPLNDAFFPKNGFECEPTPLNPRPDFRSCS